MERFFSSLEVFTFWWRDEERCNRRFLLLNEINVLYFYTRTHTTNRY